MFRESKNIHSQKYTIYVHLSKGTCMQNIATPALLRSSRWWMNSISTPSPANIIFFFSLYIFFSQNQQPVPKNHVYLAVVAHLKTLKKFESHSAPSSSAWNHPSGWSQQWEPCVRSVGGMHYCCHHLLPLLLTFLGSSLEPLMCQRTLGFNQDSAEVVCLASVSIFQPPPWLQ